MPPFDGLRLSGRGLVFPHDVVLGVSGEPAGPARPVVHSGAVGVALDVFVVVVAVAVRGDRDEFVERGRHRAPLIGPHPGRNAMKICARTFALLRVLDVLPQLSFAAGEIPAGAPADLRCAFPSGPVLDELRRHQRWQRCQGFPFECSQTVHVARGRCVVPKLDVVELIARSQSVTVVFGLHRFALPLNGVLGDAGREVV